MVGAMRKKRYLTDLNDKEWTAVKNLVETDYKKGGRPPKHSKRKMLNAIFYVLKTGCQWRYLPHNFPAWKAVYAQFSRWKNKGMIVTLNHELTKSSRIKAGKSEAPTASIADSQSVKTTEKGELKVTMVLRKLKVERGISSQTLRA